MSDSIIVRQKQNSPLFTEQPLTLRVSGTISAGNGASKMVQLLDVSSNNNMTDGSTIVYYASNSTFVVEQFPAQYLLSVLNPLDLGSF